MSSENLNRLDRYKAMLGETRPWDLVNPNTEYVSNDIQKNRFDICKNCPELIKITSQCKKCGCIMKLKTKLEKATCPIGKW